MLWNQSVYIFLYAVFVKYAPTDSLLHENSDSLADGSILYRNATQNVWWHHVKLSSQLWQEYELVGIGKGDRTNSKFPKFLQDSIDLFCANSCLLLQVLYRLC